MDKRKKLGIRNLDTGIGTAGVGFVVVPSDKEREQYIADCYRTNTLTINGGQGYGYFRGVPTDMHVMQCIEFPYDEINRGTPVVWVKDAISQLPVIVAVLRKQDDYYSLDERQFKLKRGIEEKNIEVFIDGKTSSINIAVLGDEIEPASFDIKLCSKNKDSKFSVFSDNEISVFSDNAVNVATNDKIELKIKNEGEDKLSLLFKKGEGVFYKDEFENEFNIKDGEINIISKKINHNSGEEPMVLGNKLVEILDETLKAIQAITVTSPVGPTSTPVNAASFISIQSKLNNIKSKKSNLE